jgi:hypothetical protein
MTLEEIRYQMNTYEEKREKLSLLLIDLHNKLQSLGAQNLGMTTGSSPGVDAGAGRRQPEHPLP